MSPKSITVLALIIVLGGTIWFFTRDTSVEEPLLASDYDTVGSGVAGEDLLITLQQLESVKLDDSIFKSPLFLSLRDFSRPIALEPIGRPNPFAPVDFSSATKRSTTETVQSPSLPSSAPVSSSGSSSSLTTQTQSSSPTAVTQPSRPPSSAVPPPVLFTQ